jgi:putative addiction module killer protein
VIYKSQSSTVELAESEAFRTWLNNLRDEHARYRIRARLARLASGNAGDVRPVGLGVSELRIHYGPGYRVYIQRHGHQMVLLCGGDKRSQAADIRQAIGISQEWSG